MHHPALLVTFPITEKCKPLYNNELVYNFSQCNYNVIKLNLASIDWAVIFKDQWIKSAVSSFIILFFKLLTVIMQNKQVYFSKYPVWFSSILKDLIFKKKIAHKLYKLI